MRNGIEKKIIIIISILIGIALLIGVGKIVYDQVKPKNPNRIEASYIGTNHIVGETLSIDEFEIKEVYNGQIYPIDGRQVQIENNLLGNNGADVKLSFVNREGKTLSTVINVKCLTEIDYISVQPKEDTEFYVGYNVTTDQFIVTAFNPQGYSAIVPSDFYTIEEPLMKNSTTDFQINFVNKYDGLVYTPVCTVSNGIDMYVKELKVNYIGGTKYYGQKVTGVDFEVTSILGNDNEWVVPSDYIQIENPLLSNAYNSVTVYFTNKNGSRASQTVEVPAQNYCTSISSATFIGNPKTIGDIVTTNEFEVVGKFYDGSLKNITGFDISTTNLTSLKNNVLVQYKNEVGNVLEYQAEVLAAENIIFIGDERVHDLEFDVGNIDDKVYFIYKTNADYDWLVNEGIAQANAIMEKNSLTSFRVIFIVGIEDLSRVEDYIALYKKLGNDTWAGNETKTQQKIFVSSVSPVDEEVLAKENIYNNENYMNSKIKAFNDALSEGLETEKNIRFINTYGQLINGHLSTTDGFLFDTDTNKYFYSLIKSLTQ